MTTSSVHAAAAALVLFAAAGLASAGPAAAGDPHQSQFKIFTEIVYPTAYKPSPNVKLTKSYACQIGKVPDKVGAPFANVQGGGSATTPAETWDIGHQNTMFVPYTLKPGGSVLFNTDYLYACRGTIRANGQDVTLRGAAPPAGADYGGDSPSATMYDAAMKGIGATLTIDPAAYAKVAGGPASPPPSPSPGEPWSFEVTTNPAQTATCPATITFTAVQHNGTAGLEYRYVRSDGATGPIYQSAVSAGTFPVHGDTWTLGKSYSGWEAIEWRPLPAANGGKVAPWKINSNKAAFTLTCK